MVRTQSKTTRKSSNNYNTITPNPPIIIGPGTTNQRKSINFKFQKTQPNQIKLNHTNLLTEVPRKYAKIGHGMLLHVTSPEPSSVSPENRRKSHLWRIGSLGLLNPSQISRVSLCFWVSRFPLSRSHSVSFPPGLSLSSWSPSLISLSLSVLVERKKKKRNKKEKKE